MALTINQNLYSLSSQHFLGMNQTALGKSIERLSSGLRINHAADDASGMAISEKMRGQISGLKRASMNAQDGISYLQTAEGAMEQSSAILQRLRELAVQASNGIYTTNDRAEIQKEVDQLKNELDRVSTATEFNARKLINGDGTAIWSASSPKIQALIRGPVPEGNYQIQMNVQPGKNEIQKSHIMSLREGAIGAKLTKNVSDADPDKPTNVAGVKDPVSLDPTDGKEMEIVIKDHTFTTANPTADVNGTHLQKGSSWSAGTATATTVKQSGYIEVEFLEEQTSTDFATAKFRYRFTDPLTGKPGEWKTTDNGTTGGDAANLVIKDGTDLEIKIPISVGTGKIQKEDKLLVAVSQKIDASTALAEGDAVVQMVDVDGKKGPLVILKDATPLDNGNYIMDTNDMKIHKVTLNSGNGNVQVGSLTIEFKETTDQKTVSGSIKIVIRGGGEAATSTTKLKDLKNFVDSDKNNILTRTQELTIYGNGRNALIHIEGNDTIATLVEKLNKAIVQDLKMGSDDPNVNENLVRFISDPDPSGWGTVEGTIIIQTALTGENSELSFIGPQALIKALGFTHVQRPENNETTVTVRNAHTGELIGTEITGDDRVYTIINGVEIVLDSRAGVKSEWNIADHEIVFSSNKELAEEKYFLHLVDNRTSLQIGANKGQDLDVSIPQLDLKGLRLENLTMVSQEHARRAIGMLDEALVRVVSARATIGAQVSRLEHTIVNLSTARQNITTAESRIRDLDVAEESTTFARNQILVQSGIAMLAQANQIPQMALKLIQG